MEIGKDLEPDFHYRAAPSDDGQFSIICFRIKFMDEAEFSLMLAEMQLHINFCKSGTFWNLIFSVELWFRIENDSLSFVSGSDLRMKRNSASSKLLDIRRILKPNFHSP